MSSSYEDKSGTYISRQTVVSSETSLTIYQITPRHIPDDSNLGTIQEPDDQLSLSAIPDQVTTQTQNSETCPGPREEEGEATPTAPSGRGNSCCCGYHLEKLTLDHIVNKFLTYRHVMG
jgi:hypothetical protein